jgi:predicted Zn-dependent protease
MQISANDTSVTPQKRRLFSKPRGAALFVAVCLLAALLGALTLPPAWQATERREAYLPQLEASSRNRPEDGALAALLAARLMQAGEFPAAAETLKQAAGAGEQSESVWLALAASNAASGQRGRALADLEMGAKSVPDAALLSARLADARALGQAASPGRLAGTISPQGPEALLAAYGGGSFLNGPAAWWGRRHPGESGFATRAAWVRARPGDAEAQRLWGEALARNRRLPEALAALRQAAALAPQSPACHLALADALRQGKHLQEAAQEYIAALTLRPHWLPALMGLGSAFQASDLPGYAIDSYRRATQVAPRSPDAWLGLATVLHQNDGIAASLPAFETVARLSPARTDFLDDYADALRQASRWDEAEAVLRRRLAAAPEDPYGHFVLGMILMNSRPTPARETEADKNLREALRLSPHNPVAEVQLAGLLLGRGQAPEAAQLLSDSLRRLPFERRTILLLSRAYRLTGRNALAAKAAERAAALQRDEDQASVLESARRAHQTDAAFHLRLAQVYDRLGKADKAAQERLTVQRLQGGPQILLRSQHELEAAMNAVLSPR